MSKLLYYLVLYPLSKVPLPFLYLLSNVLQFFLFRVFKYRKKVVAYNLENSFPNKDASEIQLITRQFYSHLCDIMIESVRLFSASTKETQQRCKCLNPELLEHYYKQGKSIVFGFGHHHNWEITGVAMANISPLKIICIYHPLSDTFLDKKLRASRGRSGAILVPKEDFKTTIESNKATPLALAFGTDQNPTSRSKKLFWTRFLNQDTAVSYGLEKYAVEYNAPVLFLKMRKIKRGYYEYSFETITDTPRDLVYGEITRLHTQLLERQIIDAPQYWLWTHKRWKRKKVTSNK